MKLYTQSFTNSPQFGAQHFLKRKELPDGLESQLDALIGISTEVETLNHGGSGRTWSIYTIQGKDEYTKTEITPNQHPQETVLVYNTSPKEGKATFSQVDTEILNLLNDAYKTNNKSSGTPHYMIDLFRKTFGVNRGRYLFNLDDYGTVTDHKGTQHTFNPKQIDKVLNLNQGTFQNAWNHYQETHNVKAVGKP